MKNNPSKFALTAALTLALAFTFSCSGDSGGGGGNGEQSNISSGTEANKETSSSSKGTGNSSSSSLSNSGGSSSSSKGGGSGAVKKDKISGFSQKGPFVKGSAIVLYELDDKFTQTGRSFNDIITDDKGSFEIKNFELASPYAMLQADGYYRNEVTGEISKAPIKLYAIADIREKTNVNVNLLTHLEYRRVLKLVEEGEDLGDAKKQAQNEILSVFGIKGEFKNSEDMSIFGTSDDDGALLAISVLLQSNLSEGQFTERLTDFSLGFRETGIWDNKKAKDDMADWAAGANLKSIRNGILAWNLSSVVPDFEKYIRAYWYASYGIKKVCNASSENTTVNSNKDVEFICRENVWVLGSKYSEYDRDTFGWGSCSVAGEIKKGNVSDNKYICESSAWKLASEYELDVGGLGNCSTEGVLKDGLVSGKKYVCENSSWKIATNDVGFGSCTAAIQGKIENNGSEYYICDSKVWRKATEYERDVYQWVCSTEGEIKAGQVSGTKYICKNKVWVEARYIDVKCAESKSCQTFTDARDKQSYVYVKIGEQTWMAENLNYNVTGSKCYDNNPANCDKFGRLYDWVTAMGIDAKYEGEKWGGSDVKHKGICPAGWHLPSNEELDILITTAGGYDTAGKSLKSTSGWANKGKIPSNGTDTYGFAAFPVGVGDWDGGFSIIGYGFYWWSATEVNASYAYFRDLCLEDNVNYNLDHDKTRFYPVRCVQD